MRKLLTALTICFVIVGLMGCGKKALAEINLIDELKKLPAINNALIYSFDDKDLQYASTITLATLLNEKIDIDIGWTPKQQLLGAVSFKLVEVKDYIKFPVLNWVVFEPMIYIGLDRLNSDESPEIKYGLGVKIISLKF